MQQGLEVVRKFFPNALPTEDTVNRLLDILKDEFEIYPHQIMLADSICSDDVNTMEYPQRAYQMRGPLRWVD